MSLDAGGGTQHLATVLPQALEHHLHGVLQTHKHTATVRLASVDANRRRPGAGKERHPKQVGESDDSGIKYKRIQGIWQNPRAAVVSVSGSIRRNRVQRLFLFGVFLRLFLRLFFQRHPDLSE